MKQTSLFDFVPAGAVQVGHALVAEPGSDFEKELQAELAAEQAAHPNRTIEEARAALVKLKDFIGHSQCQALRQNFKDEERQYFFNLVCDLAELVRTMPQTRGQEDVEDPIAYLHYFAGGQASWWITEKDMGNGPGDMDQHQAFGLADLFGDGGEIGYISIVEILANGGELDFHFTPKPLSEVRN